MLQDRADLAFMRRKVVAGEEPWKGAWENLRRQHYSSLEFKPRPFTRVIRGPYGNPNIGGEELASSADAAHSHALQWVVTGDRAHAQKVIEILAAWSPVLESFHDNDAKLLAGWTGHKFCNAAEIIRHTNAGWEAEGIEQFRRMLQTVYVPLLRDFFPEANGNWDAAIIDTLLCIGIFCDDRALFDRAVDHFLRGPGNGGITRYIYPSGQCQESTRDQGHVQLGLGEFAQACQVAWTQGVDFYATADNRLALGFEYTARFLAGAEVPAQGGLSPRRPGRLQPIYDGVYQHYHFVKGLEMPSTARAMESTRAGSWAALTSYKGPASDGPAPAAKPDAMGPPRPSPIAAAARALHEPTARPPEDAVLVRPGASVQQALESCRGRGGWVVLARGLHRLPAPLHVPDGVTLAGQGFDSILWLDPTLTGPALVNADGDLRDVTLRDFVIEGATASELPSDPNADRRRRARPGAPARAGIQLVAKDDGRIEGVRLEHLVVRNCTITGVRIEGASGIVVDACDFSDNGSIAPDGAAPPHNLALARVTDCTISASCLDTSPLGSGVDVLGSRAVTIAGNEVARNGRSGIRVAGSRDVRIRGNLAEGNLRGGIVVEANPDREGGRRVDVRDNLARNNSGRGIEVTPSGDARLEGNTERDNGRVE
jgi:parallel beta-helix repeat protein